MNRALGLVLLGGLLAAGCESSPFQKKESNPPVTLLEDEEQQAGGGTVAPAGGAAPSAPSAPFGDSLSLARSQRFGDIPLPEGLTTDNERTFVYESDTLTIGRMVYTTKQPVNDVAQFFINQAPVSGWRRENIIEADGVDLLFRKPDKRLDVNVRNLGRSTTMLVIRLTPEVPSSAPAGL